MTADLWQPGLVLFVCGLAVMFLPDKVRKVVMLLAPILTIGLCLAGAMQPTVTEAGAQARLAHLFALTFAVTALIADLYNLQCRDRFEVAAELIYAGSSLGVVFSQTWIGMLIFWELMAVSSWFIVIAGHSRDATRAGFRYLLMHMLGGNLLLAGVVLQVMHGSTLIHLLTGQTGASFWLILAGVAVNAAIPPLHSWIADAYPQSSAAGTVYMGSYTTKVGVYCLIRLFAGTHFLLYFGVFMAVWGACMALIENDLRRLFSYHIVSQVGYMVAALAFGTPLGIDGAAAHAVNNILYKGTLLMCAGSLIMATGRRTITQLSGLAKKMPLTAGCFLVASLSIAGIPPLNGFASKALIMQAAEEGPAWAELLLLLASVGTFLSITLKVNYFVFFGKPDQAASQLPVRPEAVPWNSRLAMVLGAAGCVVLGVFPGLLYGQTPYQSDAHPFTVAHVTQYGELFAGAALVFFLCLSHMRPKEMLTLDVDWLYRKPLKAGLLLLSRLVDGLRLWIGNILAGVLTHGKAWLSGREVLRKTRAVEKAEKKDAKREKGPKPIEKDDVLQKPVGWLVALNIGVLVGAALLVIWRLR